MTVIKQCAPMLHFFEVVRVKDSQKTGMAAFRAVKLGGPVLMCKVCGFLEIREAEAP